MIIGPVWVYLWNVRNFRRTYKFFSSEKFLNKYLFPFSVIIQILIRRISGYFVFGNGMNPELKELDMIFIKNLNQKELDKLKIGEIVAYSTFGQEFNWKLFIPKILGKLITISQRNDYMHPTIKKNDIVFFQKFNAFKRGKKSLLEGDIVLFRFKLDLLIGRIVKINLDKFQIAFDNLIEDELEDKIFLERDILGKFIEARKYFNNKETAKEYIVLGRIKNLNNNEINLIGDNEKSNASICVPSHLKDEYESLPNLRNNIKIPKKIIKGKLISKSKYSFEEMNRITYMLFAQSFCIALIFTFLYFFYFDIPPISQWEGDFQSIFLIRK